MDGPAVGWTPFDLLKSAKDPRIPLTYHVMGAGYDFLTPVGAILGGGLYTTGLWRPLPSVLTMMGTSGLVAGGMGSVLGLAGMAAAARKGEANTTTLPWNEDGIQTRVNGLSHNFMVRVLDVSVWSGIGLAAGLLLFKGGPTALGLSKGTLGTFQALSLGSSVGSLSGMACIFATKRQERKELEGDDE